MPAVGLVIPASNTVMEGDFHRALDGHASVHTGRMLLEDVTAAGEGRMLDEEALPAVRRLAQTSPDVVVFGCTSAGALRGAAYDEELRRQLGEAAGAPVLGVMASVVAQLRGHRAVALFTPYVAELTERVAGELEAAGIPVATTRGLGLSDNAAIGALTPERIVEAVAEMDLAGADAVLCSCTNLRAVEALDALSDAVGLPVFSSNQAVLDEVREALDRLAPVSAAG